MSVTRRPTFLAPGVGDRFVGPWPEEVLGKLSGSSTGGAFELIEISPDLHWARPPYVHHEVDECFYVAAGSFIAYLETAETPLEMVAGALLFVPRGVARSIESTTPSSRLVIISTPAARPLPAEPCAGIEFLITSDTQLTRTTTRLGAN